MAGAGAAAVYLHQIRGILLPEPAEPVAVVLVDKTLMEQQEQLQLAVAAAEQEAIVVRMAALVVPGL